MKRASTTIIRLFLLSVLSLTLAIASTSLWAAKSPVSDKSDLNSDGVVDLLDVEIFSTNYLEMAVFQVDWCLFYESTIAGMDFEGKSTAYYLRHFKELLAFIYEEFDCEPGPFLLELQNAPVYPMRMAQSVTGDYYISDPRVGSVFYYNEAFEPQLELKGLVTPLGVAIDTQGNILVGNNGKDNVEVYRASDGNLLNVFGSDRVRMPNSITVAPAGEILVVDSESHVVWVYDASYQFLRAIGTPGSGESSLEFPIDAEVMSREIEGETVYEVFVADQGNKRVQVYDLAGNWLAAINFDGVDGQNCSWFTGVCEIPGLPPFTRLQALDIDAQGRLHVLDSFAAAGMVFDAIDGTFIESYGGYGEQPGKMRLPMDVLINGAGEAVVTAGDGVRIESYTVQ
jgi:hypothetical protein